MLEMGKINSAKKTEQGIEMRVFCVTVLKNFIRILIQSRCWPQNLNFTLEIDTLNLTLKTERSIEMKFFLGLLI